jgi:glutathione S-transferase
MRRYWGIGGGQTSQQRAAFEAQLSSLQSTLQRHGGPFLMGERLTLADIAYYPFARRFDVGMPHFCGYDLSAALGGSVGGWLQAMGQRESCGITTADDALLLAAYQQHRSLDFFDYDPYGVFDLHPQNAMYLAAAQ